MTLAGQGMQRERQACLSDTYATMLPALAGASRDMSAPRIEYLHTAQWHDLILRSLASNRRISLERIAVMSTPLLKRAWAQRREAAGAVLYWLGLGHGFAALTRPTGAVILMYHSVAPDELAEFIDPPNRLAPQDFERQMAFLHNHRRVVSLSDLVTQLESGRSPAAGTVCVTFDDGYLDNLTTAAPILERYALPATMFVPTGYIDRAETQWADALHRLFLQRTANQLRIPSIGLAADLNGHRQRAAARKLLHKRLLEATYAERHELLVEVEHQLRPTGPAPRLTMNWDELRELARRYPLFDIGGHSRGHTDLRAYRGEIARDEIAGCAEDLRRELKREPQHFSFPYGRWSEESRSLVRAAGWRSAMGDSNDFRIGLSTDRYVMARPDTPNSMTALRFRTSAAFPGVLSLLGMN
jgi:peptidoglycan/xylan/chitin deacetylase (PgdA/CDA1 family)